MTRVKAVYEPGDYPGTPDDATKADIAALFAHVCPGMETPRIDKNHAGIAIAALNPRLALNLAKLSAFIALELPWCRNVPLRELAIQTVHLHFKCDYSFQARLKHARGAGVDDASLAAIPHWRDSQLFTDEQRLVIEYTQAVVRGDVPAALFQRVVDRYGETGAVEFTTAVGFWSCWAMLINATGPELQGQ